MQGISKNDKNYSYTKSFHWFFTDIVASANPLVTTDEQLEKITTLNKMISNSTIFRKTRNNLALVPTGDGIAIGFPESPEHPVQLSIDLHKLIRKYNENKRGKKKLTIRIGIDTGPVYVLKSLDEKENYWGPGIILSRRIMDVAGDMQIFCSKKFGTDIKKLTRKYREIIHEIGSYETKHNEIIEICNIYDKTTFGNKSIPKKDKIVNKKEIDKDFLGKNNFSFNEIHIKLDVTNTETNLTHHTWVWNIENISKNPQSHIFYYIDGDSEKDFSEMNVKVTDSKVNHLDVEILKNNPTHKEFRVYLKKPLKPKQKIALIMEYDWEEPDRNYFYKLVTNCKKFQYTFSIPKSENIRNRICSEIPELGQKWLASPLSKITYGPKFTTINWEKTNLKANEAYSFDW